MRTWRLPVIALWLLALQYPIGSVESALAAPSPAIYFARCTQYPYPGTCALYEVDESLPVNGAIKVETVEPWAAGCGPSNNNSPAAVSADGSTAINVENVSPNPAAGDSDCRLAITKLASGIRTTLKPGKEAMFRVEAFGFVLSPNGRYLALPGGGFKHLLLLDLDSGSVRTLPTGFAVEGVAWSTDGTKLLVDGPSDFGGGRGSAGETDRLFTYTLSGARLHRWTIFSNVHGFAARTAFLTWPKTDLAVGSLDVTYNPDAGGHHITPGYYSFRLKNGQAHRSLLLKKSPLPIAADPARHLIAYPLKNTLCTLNYATRVRRCVQITPGAPRPHLAGIAVPAVVDS